MTTVWKYLRYVLIKTLMRNVWVLLTNWKSVFRHSSYHSFNRYPQQTSHLRNGEIHLNNLLQLLFWKIKIRSFPAARKNFWSLVWCLLLMMVNPRKKIFNLNQAAVHLLLVVHLLYTLAVHLSLVVILSYLTTRWRIEFILNANPSKAFSFKFPSNILQISRTFLS